MSDTNVHDEIEIEITESASDDAHVETAKDRAKRLAQQKREHYTRWYDSNKDRVAKQRAHRYRNDPEYRQRIKDARKRQLEREKAERAMRSTPTGNVIENRRIKEFKVEHPTLGSVIAKFYSIGQLALQLDVSVVTIRRWEKAGILPAPCYKTEGGHRLFSDDQVTAIVQTYTAHLMKQGNKKKGFRPSGEFSVAVKAEMSRLELGIKPSRFQKQ